MFSLFFSSSTPHFHSSSGTPLVYQKPIYHLQNPLVTSPSSSPLPRPTMRYLTSTLAIVSLLLPSISALSAQPISLARGLGPDLKPRQLGVYAGTCAKLTADLDLTAAVRAGQVVGATGAVKALVGACLCVDVKVPLFGPISATAYVKASTGADLRITGQAALNLAGNVSFLSSFSLETYS